MEYRNLEKAVRQFLRDLQSYCEQLQQCFALQEGIGESWAQIFSEGKFDQVPYAVQQYNEAWKLIQQKFLPQFVRNSAN